MSYKQALEKAWGELSNLAEERNLSVKLLADKYDVDLGKQSVFSTSCNVPAKAHISIIILHYLTQRLKLKILPKPTGKWISFKQLEGGEGYYPAFRKRAIDPILRKYGSNPEALFEATERFCAKRVQTGDVGIVLEVFENVPVLITIWKADEEFGPEVNINFDESISKIFCTEDIAVLTELTAHLL